MNTTFVRAPLRHDGGPIIQSVVKALGQSAYAIERMGSRVTCNPAPANTDEDWLLLIGATKDEPYALVTSDPFVLLRGLGFKQDGNPEFYTGDDEGGFRSWRLGDINIVTTEDPKFYARFMTATHLAKRFNLLDKSDRIALFQAVLYGVDVTSLEPKRAEEVNLDDALFEHA